MSTFSWVGLILPAAKGTVPTATSELENAGTHQPWQLHFTLAAVRPSHPHSVCSAGKIKCRRWLLLGQPEGREGTGMNSSSGGWCYGRAQCISHIRILESWAVHRQVQAHRNFWHTYKVWHGAKFHKQVFKIIKIIWLLPPRAVFSGVWSIMQCDSGILLPKRLQWNPQWGFRSVSGKWTFQRAGYLTALPSKFVGIIFESEGMWEFMDWMWISPARGAKDSGQRCTPLLQSWSVSMVNICYRNRRIFSRQSPSLRFLGVAAVILSATGHTPQWKAVVKRQRQHSQTLSPPHWHSPSPPAPSHSGTHKAMPPPSVPQKEAANSLCPWKRTYRTLLTCRTGEARI